MGHRGVDLERYYIEGARLEGLGRYDEAFDAFAEGSRRQRADFEPGKIEQTEIEMLRTVETGFTRAFIEHYRGAGHGSTRPIFVFGLPRSGTTLIEQILASHPSVIGMGETP